MKWKRLLKGLIRIHAGFSIIRINSLGIRYPKGTDVDLLNTAATKIKRKLGD
ncbi:hypothetical protein [Pyrococcus abyssi]|uniref:hypothetical protein n=1 Tax=Pyrococcus abyssi TaxID=29292 RepID=UPI000B2FFCBC|nr:hypothetical protein [Pyrococcus abyssi]